MLRPITIIIAVFAALPVFADGPSPAAAPAIQFPGVAPTPASPVLPDAVSTLLPTQLYVVTSDQPFLLLASPARMVTITQEQGPIKIRATFADGAGKLETRTYAARYVAIVESASDGRVELLGVPAGVTDESEITRRLIDCGKGPIPPPDVEPEPDVTPTPGPVGFRVIMVYETSAALAREQSNILNSTKLRGVLNEVCSKGPDGRAEWRCWDKDVVIGASESPEMVKLWNAVKGQVSPLPRLVVAVNGKATVMDLPASEDATIAKVKEMAGAK